MNVKGIAVTLVLGLALTLALVGLLSSAPSVYADPGVHYVSVTGDCGGNSPCYDSVQAAVLSVKLKYLDQWNRKRQQHAALYDKLFADSLVKPPKVDANNTSIYHQYTITVPDRDALLKFLAEIWLNEEIQKFIDEDTWKKFIESIKQP